MAITYAAYVVQSGDCLWNIAKAKFNDGTKYTQIKRKSNNNYVDIPSPYTIYTGETVYYPTSGGGGGDTSANKTNRPEILFLGLLAGTNTLFATWKWSKSHTKSYKIVWYYTTGDGSTWIVGNSTENTVDSDSPEDAKQSTYSIPSNATKVIIKVIAISQTYTSNNTEVSHWISDWSTKKEYNAIAINLPVPSIPTVTINNNLVLTAELSNITRGQATKIEFQIVKGNTKVFNSSPIYATINTTTNYASCTYKVDAGYEYAVRCRSIYGKYKSEWSQFCANVTAKPSKPSSITVCKALETTSVYLEWKSVANATSYKVDHTTTRSDFDDDKEVSVTSSNTTKQTIKGLEPGHKYFFRVKAVNSAGESEWSKIKSVTIGTVPVAPTTWSSTTTAIVGEPLNLYWVHNSEDNSSMTRATLGITIGSGEESTYVIKRTETTSVQGEVTVTLEWVGASAGTLSASENTNICTINTSSYTNGTSLKWRVKTAGVTGIYGEWSIQRTVDIYAQPTLSVSMEDVDGDDIETLTSFPFYIYALAGPNTQAPIGYHLSIISDEAYKTVDNIGNTKMVAAGEEVYSKYFDIASALIVEFTPNNIDLENNQSYTVSCTVTMDSGLSVTNNSVKFEVSWTDNQYEPSAEISIDNETLAAYIRPYCEDEDGNLISGLTLAVYRREFDGNYTEIASGINNLKNTFVTDPHPSLDYARYRIVATTTATGSVSYYDPPGYPMNGKSVVIQWAEEWTNFDVEEDEVLALPSWTGSMLLLPYNIDVSDKHNADVSVVEYIGRKHPVAYYGTQLGESSTWNVEIPKDDKETLYALRRLANWMGDVYVREPSGSGYWATISVSFSQKHCEVTIPVTFEITRVEGGM